MPSHEPEIAFKAFEQLFGTREEALVKMDANDKARASMLEIEAVERNMLHDFDDKQIFFSIALSLKRIADALTDPRDESCSLYGAVGAIADNLEDRK